MPYCEIDKYNYEKYKLQNGDIVIARTGASTGCNKIIKSLKFEAVFASYLIRYRINESRAYPPYIGFVLKSSNWYGYIEAIAGGSAQPGANAKQLGSYTFLLPPLPERKAIASILSSLDDKIDLLHRQNKTLESMAETIFRYWFIENANDKWEEKSLSEIADFLNGLACQKFRPQNDIDKLPVLKIKELNSGISESSDWATTDIPEKYIINAGDVIFAWSASLMLKIWDGDTCILNQHLFKVTSAIYPKWFYYQWCKFHLAEFISISSSHATTMGHIKRSDLDNAKVLIPFPNELKQMSNKMQPLLEKQIFNSKQISTLENLRDTLLPKLINGEVGIN